MFLIGVILFRHVSVVNSFYIDVAGDINGDGYSYTITTTKHGVIDYTYEFNGGQVTTNAEFEAFVNIERHGRRNSFHTDFGISFAHKYHYAQLNVPHAYRENLEGLCGDWNSHKTDDMR